MTTCEDCGSGLEEYPLLLDGEETGETETVCPWVWHPDHP